MLDFWCWSGRRAASSGGTDLLAACTSCRCQLQVPAVVHGPGAALHPLQHQKSSITTFYHTTTNLPPPCAPTHLRTLRTACAAIVLSTWKGGYSILLACTGLTAVRSIDRSIERTTGATDRNDKPVRRAVVAYDGRDCTWRWVQGKVRVLYVNHRLSIAGYLTCMPGCTAWQSGPGFLVVLQSGKRAPTVYGEILF